MTQTVPRTDPPTDPNSGVELAGGGDAPVLLADKFLLLPLLPPTVLDQVTSTLETALIGESCVVKFEKHCIINLTQTLKKCSGRLRFSHEYSTVCFKDHNIMMI